MDTILSNNLIKSDPVLNLSCVSGSVLESMLLFAPLEKPFSANRYSVARPTTLISDRGDLVAADEQRELLHPVAVDGFDGTAKLSFAKTDPGLRSGAIE